MKKIIPLALLCAAMIPTSAMALVEGNALAVRVNGQPAGTLNPSLSAPSPAGSCLFAAEWTSPGGTDSTDCDFLETKTVGHSSCANNAHVHFATMILAPYVACQGYDQLGRVKDVDLMILGESTTGTFSGIVQFDGSTAAYSISMA